MLNTRISRRSLNRAAATLAVLGPASFVAACASPGGGDSAASAPRPADLKGVTIEAWTWNGATHPESIAKTKVLDDFTAKNTYGIKVNVSAPGNGGAETFQKYVAALTGGTPPDMADGQHFYLSDLSRQGGLVDVATELKGNADWAKALAGLTPEIKAGFTWKGKMYGIPLYSSHFAMYYQPEFLKRAGVAVPAKGWTWDQFVTAGKSAQQPPDVWAYEDNWSYSRTGMVVINNGHKMMNADGTKFSYNSPEAIEAVEWQVGLLKAGMMPKQDDYPDNKWKEWMPEGKVVFEFAVAARVPKYRKDGTQFGTTYYPLGKSNKDKKSYTHGEAYGFSVFKNKDAKKQQAALLAGLWGTRADMGKLMADEAGVPPSYKYTIEDPAFQAQYKKDADTWPFFDLISGFTPMPNFPGFGDVRTMGDKMILDIWTGKGTTKQVLDEYTRLAQQKLDEVLR